MFIGDRISLQELPRDRLEEITAQALLELGRLRREAVSRKLFGILCTGLLIGAALSAAGFLIGTALR